MANIMRVALIGKTGVGKSALGNTLLGENLFDSSVGGESQTSKAESKIGKLSNGNLIKVVDTPGIMDTRGREEMVRNEVTKVIGYLSPGPHAFIIVLRPDRSTKEEREVIKDLQKLFGNKTFLNYTILVMVRKNEIRDRDRKKINIHDYINKSAGPEVKELYELCGRRIVAVENYADDEELQTYALAVASEIEKLGGKYFSHEYFQLVQEMKIKDEELERSEEEKRRLRQKLQDKIQEEGNEFCAIL